MESAELLAALEDGSLAPALFNHRNHVRAAWQCLQAQAALEAVDAPLRVAAFRFRDSLLAYTRKLDAEHKFHLTLTLAFMHLVHERFEAGETWPAFEARNAPLFHDAQTLIQRHYSAEALERGRRVFIEPDRLPLP